MPDVHFDNLHLSLPQQASQVTLLFWRSRQLLSTWQPGPSLTRRAPAADFACVAPPGSSRDGDPQLAEWVRSFDQGSRRQKKPDADLHGDNASGTAFRIWPRLLGKTT